jgi:hypothetical protein
MNMRDIKKKPKTKPVSRKQLGTHSEALLKKELLEAFNLLTAVAKLFEQERRAEKLENTGKTGIHIKTHAMMAKTVEAEKTETMKKADATLPKHLGRAIMAAETWEQRDLVCRRFSAWCYEWSKYFLNRGDFKNASKWVTLSQRFLKLSMDPKKQITEEKLQELEDMMSEIEERQKEEEDKTKF